MRPFASTDTTDYGEFSNYLSESIISAIHSRKSKYKIYERSRLDVILKENSLALTGILSDKDALKIGEIAPIDVILSGTYTKLESKISLNIRLIDVVTGEVLLAFSSNIKLSDELRVLFKRKEIQTEVKDPCKGLYNEVSRMMEDLSTDEKIKSIVERISKVPFDLNCGRIHFKVINRFEKYKIDSQEYKKFLIKEILNIEYPSIDRRSIEILNYFTIDKVINKEEWDTGISVIKKLKGSDLTYHLKPLLIHADNENVYKWIDEYFVLLRIKK